MKVSGTRMDQKPQFIFSIRNKMVFLIIFIVLFISFFTALEVLTNGKIQDQDAGSLISDIIDETTTIEFAVKNNDVKLIQQSLLDLRLHPGISAAEIYSYNNQSFSDFLTDDSHENLTVSHSELSFLNKLHLNIKSSKPIFFQGYDLKLLDPIEKNNKIIAAVLVKASLGNDLDISNLIKIIFLFSMITVFFAMRFEELISNPLLQLDNAMTHVITQNDYSTRITKVSNDEIGHLNDTFNIMLEKIQYNENLQRISQEQIKKLAYYDTLTGFSNRDFFKELFNQAIVNAKENNKLMGVLYFDLDNFKQINDVFGHDAGDELLRHAAKNIQKCALDLEKNGLQSNAILARLGGDEFIIVLNNIADVEDAKRVADQIIKLSYKPYTTKGKEIVVSASIGIALYPIHGESSDELMKKADIAMYFSKQHEKGGYTVFNEKMNTVLINKIGIENDLRKAVERNELVLFYQPQFQLSQNTIVGFEALLRWNHPTKGFLSPDEFIPIAENTGLIIAIGAWVIQEACRQCQEWHMNGFEGVRVSVNISPRQFSDANLIAVIKNALNDTGLDPRYLDIELTEGMIMLNDQKTLDLLHKFKEIGVKISIDDFGTGYSSLRYLSQYPIDILKIDKTFISYVNENKKNATVTKAIIDLSHNLNLSVIAEGVETIEQLNYLKINGCDIIQGYIISRPLPNKEIPSLFLKYGRQINA